MEAHNSEPINITGHTLYVAGWPFSFFFLWVSDPPHCISEKPSPHTWFVCRVCGAGGWTEWPEVKYERKMRPCRCCRVHARSFCRKWWWSRRTGWWTGCGIRKWGNRVNGLKMSLMRWLSCLEGNLFDKQKVSMSKIYLQSTNWNFLKAFESQKQNLVCKNQNLNLDDIKQSKEINSIFFWL